MCASFFRALRSGPPPPKVTLLPDALFFTRSVLVAAGATPAEAASQIELALEAVSPFPLAQLYYGWFWTPGADHAFVYAAYRRRFTAEQTAAWADAELVLPVSATLLGAEVKPATTAILTTPEGLTAVHWETPAVPSKVLFRPIDPEATDEDRARLREELIDAMGGSKAVVDLPAPPVPEAAKTDREIVFREGDFVSRLPATSAAALDVRDKNDLAALRQARQRDVILWRVALGCAAALVLLGLGQIALIGGNAWQKVRIAQVKDQKPRVDKIKNSQALAVVIDDLVNKRLLPLEMVTMLVGVDNKWKPQDITLTRIDANAESDGLYKVTLEVQTNNPQAIGVYQNQILGLPECETIKVTPRGGGGDRSLYSVVVTFKPGMVKPTPSA